MTKFKKLLIMGCLLLVIIFSPSMKAMFSMNAQEDYLEAKDYFSLDEQAVDEKIKDFLNICQKQGKEAFFNSGTYRLNNNLQLVDGVSLIGDSKTIFQGVKAEYQVVLIDSAQSVSNISIEKIVFDNVTIYSNNLKSENWTIKENIFMNAKMADLNLQPGLKPDSNNKNGGENTGYYILRNYNAITIKSNLFFRDSQSLGRGIALYKTKDSVIVDNYFGEVFDLSQSIVSEVTKKLINKVSLKNTQGYFMTGINALSGDTNTLIKGNHFSFNKDMVEAEYEDGTQTTKGYNRDHIIYAKEYEGLKIIANYFKGMPKNQDGGVKCRNGNDLVVYKNIFEDTLMMGYVQTGSRVNKFTNVLIDSNIFINKDFSPDTITLTSPNTNQQWIKYFTTDFLFLFMNYVGGAVVDQITISNNEFYSFGTKNEHIRFDYNNFAEATNLTLENNQNYLQQTIEYGFRRRSGIANETKKTDYSNGTKYQASISNEDKQFNPQQLISLNNAKYNISEKKLSSQEGSIYLDKQAYGNETLVLNQEYDLFIFEPTTIALIVEGQEYEIASNLYTCKSICPQINIPKNIQVPLGEEYILPLEIIDLDLNDLVVSQTDNLCDIQGATLIARNVGITNMVLSCNGFNVTVELEVFANPLINNFSGADVVTKLSEKKNLQLDYDSSKEVNFSYAYDKTAFILDTDTLSMRFLKVGIFDLIITEHNSQLVKTIKVNVLANKLSYKVEKTHFFVKERLVINVYVNDVLSEEFRISGLNLDNGQYFSEVLNPIIKIIDLSDETNFSRLYLNFEHFYSIKVNSPIVINVMDSALIDLQIESTNPMYQCEYEYDSDFITIKDGAITGKKAGTVNVRIMIVGSNIFCDLVVKIEKKVETKTNNYSIIIGSACTFIGIIGIAGVLYTQVKKRKSK